MCIRDRAWMIECLNAYQIEFNESYIKKNISPDHLGELRNSRIGMYRFLGKHIRRINSQKIPIKEVHESVLLRLQENSLNYRPENVAVDLPEEAKRQNYFSNLLTISFVLFLLFWGGCTIWWFSTEYAFGFTLEQFWNWCGNLWSFLWKFILVPLCILVILSLMVWFILFLISKSWQRKKKRESRKEN